MAEKWILGPHGRLMPEAQARAALAKQGTSGATLEVAASVRSGEVTSVRLMPPQPKYVGGLTEAQVDARVRTALTAVDTPDGGVVLPIRHKWSR